MASPIQASNSIVNLPLASVTGPLSHWRTPARQADGERRLEAPLLRFLEKHGWVLADTLIIHELSWHGRHVDMATRTRSGRLSSYEFKLKSFGRVLEQAIYNRLSFDQSYVVVAAIPRRENLTLAEQHDVGVIIVQGFNTTCLLRSPVRRADPELRDRLEAKVLAAGEANV
jgi:hypothetical protein